MASVDDLSQSGPSTPHIVSYSNASSDVIAVERSSPEVFHVVSAPHAGGPSPNVSTSASTMALSNLNSSAAGNVQTITISAGNLTFPVTLGGQAMVSES